MPHHLSCALLSDEGINAIKALLVDRGHPLYTQIWSDQPPLFTHLLHGWFSAFGWQVDAGRLLVLVFASLIVFASYDLVRRACGHGAALAACALLPLTSSFALLSVSIMIGLPALAFALLALWALIHWRPGASRWWIAAGAVLMACSLATKLFTLFLVPLFAAWLLLAGRLERRPDGAWWMPALAWTAATAAAVLGLFAVLVGAGNLWQLYSPHASARALDLAARFDAATPIAILRDNWQVALLAAVGTGAAAARRRYDLLVLSAWGLAALAALGLEAPVWYHHYLLFTVAACPIAGVGLAALLASGRAEVPRPRAVRFGAQALALLLLTSLTYDAIAGAKLAFPPWVERGAAPLQALAAMERYRDRTHTVVTDRPMYAFRAGYEVPPNLAVVSFKRLQTHYLSAIDFVAAVRLRPPEQIVLSGRLPRPIAAAILRAAAGRYDLVFTNPPFRDIHVYVRRDVLQAAELGFDSPRDPAPRSQAPRPSLG